MQKYIHFDLHTRRLIARKINVEGLSYEIISQHLCVAKSAVWNEVRRNRVRVVEKVRRSGMLNGAPIRLLDKWFMYDAEYADHKAHQRAKAGRVLAAASIVRLTPGTELYNAVEERLVRGRKPDVIAGRLKLNYPDDPSMWVSHETIYQYAYNTPESGWYEYFVKARKKRRPRSQRKSSIPDRVSIKHRPKDVENRGTFGHLEGDTVVGYAGNPSKHVVATIVERKTRKLFAGISADKSSPNTIGVISNIFAGIQGLVKSVTFDNGSEFTLHGLLTQKHQVEVYFADPYSSWQRGSNERHNGLLRKYFPKGTDFGQVTAGELQEVVDFWNDYPRKVLGYRTPNEVWADEVSALA